MARVPFRLARHSDPNCEDRLEVTEHTPGGVHGTAVELMRRQLAEADARERARLGGEAPARTSAVAVALEVGIGGATLLQIGDARAYLFRRAPAEDLPIPLAPRFSPEVFLDDGSALVCLTWDHSTACELVEMELIPRADGRRRANERVLYRSLGRAPACEPDLVPLNLDAGDRLLLCNAGLWLAVEDAAIADLLGREPDTRSACDALAQMAAQNGTPHPVALVLVDWLAPGEAGAHDESQGAREGSGPPVDTPPTPGSVLRRHGRDLTAWAADQPRAPVVGRKDELRQLMRTLMRLQKPNALLVGDAGVGKTWLVEALARVLGSPACPPALKRKRVVELSLGSLLAGARYRGDFEERLQGVLEEARSDRDLILFLDEIHMAMGAGAVREGGMDAANLLKPALASGDLRLIGATTTREFERHIARDEAFVRRFDVLRIEEPAPPDAVRMLEGLRERLEEHHGVRVTDDAIRAAVQQTVRYLPERKLPDKAIDILDQACVRAVSRWLSMSFSAGAAATEPEEGYAVGPDDVAAVIAERCRVPLDLVSLEDDQRLARLPRLLGARVFGQEQAVTAVAEALQHGYRGVSRPEQPVCSLLFTGPSGVGKTAMARSIAEILFSSATAVARFDMSEYRERHSISRLLGAAPGYVGHEEEGLLTAALRARPACVVLFDEVDKAHPDVLQVLLQILDEGSVHGARGTEAWFRQAVVVLTCNLPAATGTAGQRRIGFGADPATNSTADAEAALRKQLERQLRPELVGRIDRVIRFEPLEADALRSIAGAHLQAVVERLLARGAITAPPPSRLRDQILAAATAHDYGARDIQRMVEREVGAWLDAAPQRRRAIDPGAAVVDRLRSRTRAHVALVLVRGVAPESVQALLDEIATHASACDLLFLKHAGDGALALFGSAARALELAGAELGAPSARRVLHWGEVARRADGQPTGPDLDRLLEIGRAHDPRLAGAGLLLTRPARGQLPEDLRERLEPLGAVELGAGAAHAELWTLSPALAHGSSTGDLAARIPEPEPT